MNAKRPSRYQVSDDFWAQVEPWVPVAPPRPSGRPYQRAPGGGRKPLSHRVIFEAIVYVMRTGCPWKDLPERHFGSASAIHKHFRHWAQCGFFFTLWNQGLAQSPELEGIAWQLQSRDPDNSSHTPQWRPAGLRRRRHSGAQGVLSGASKKSTPRRCANRKRSP
jgi:transposase